MDTQTVTKATDPNSVETKIQKLKELFADAPPLGKAALQNVLKEIAADASNMPPPVESAGRIGSRLGKVSELTMMIPFAPGGAQRLRTFLRALNGNLTKGAELVGTLHNMRFVFLENDTKLLFATTFDGDWDAYIDDFVTKIPD